MTEKGERASFFSVVPNWVSAIAGALAALAAIVFGVAELGGNDTEKANSVDTTTSTRTESQSPVPISEADLQDVGTDIIRVGVPTEWDQRRDFVAPWTPGDTAKDQIPTYVYAAAEDVEATEGAEFYGSSGFSASISTDLDTLKLDRTSSSDDVLATLDDVYPLGTVCDPQYSQRDVRPREYEGVLRDWRGCSDVGGRMTDGLLFAEDGSHFIYVQLRVAPYEWEAAVDTILSTIDVDVDSLVVGLHDASESSAEGTTP